MSRAFTAILLDIEGTTTPINFVYDVLFPYARARVVRFLVEHMASNDLETDLEGLRAEHEEDQGRELTPPPLRSGTPEIEVESIASYVQWLMDLDRKSTPLKSLQGKIWKDGYESEQLIAQVFPDVPSALASWRAEGKAIFIFSSGSVLAQQLLFEHTAAGDLTGLIDGYFDTEIGAKTDPASYRTIAKRVQRAPEEILFISDVAAELDAAGMAGVQTALSVRPGNRPQPATAHRSIRSFDELIAPRARGNRP